jgi:hypothetical protein
MVNHVHVLLKANVKKCIVSISFPLVIFGVAFLIGEISGVTQNEYIDRLHSDYGLISKFIFNSILGIIGISLWYKYFTHIGIKSLACWNRVVFESNGAIFCFGREICKMRSIDSVSIESNHLKISLFISHHGHVEYCGNLIFCDDVDGLVDTIHRLKEHNTSLRNHELR